MSYFPLNYNQINVEVGTYSPSTAKVRNSKAYEFWERALFQRAVSALIFDGFPDNWDGEVKDFIIYCLFRNGYLMVAENTSFGIFAQPCTLYGQDFYYRPTNAQLSNPKLSGTYEIHKDCEIIKLTPDYRGAWDIISYYAEKLALLDNAINMAINNSKFAFILGAKNKSAAAAVKKMLDEINKGNPAVVYDQRILDDATSKTDPFQFIDFGNIKQKYITTDLLNDFKTLIANFDGEIGIPSPYEKRERLITQEAELQSADAVARATVWVETLNDTMSLVNDRFGLSLSVKLRFEERGEENVNSKTDNAELSQMDD